MAPLLEVQVPSETTNRTKPLKTDAMTTGTATITAKPQMDDEEARLREVLSKKKIIQKQIRRRNSTDPPPVNDSNKAPAPAHTAKSQCQAPEDDGRKSKKTESSTAVGWEKDERSGDKYEKVEKNGSNASNSKVNGSNPLRSNRRSRRRRRRNRAANRVLNMSMGGGRGGGHPLPDSRSYYGGGPDYRGPPGQGFYGDRGRDWDRRGPYRDAPYGRDGRDGGYYGGGPNDRYRADRGGRGRRDDGDPYGPPRRGRGPPVGGGSERGRSRSISSRSYSRSSSRSYSSSSRSRSSRSRSYSSRSRSASRGRGRSRSYSRSVSRPRSRSVGSRSYSRSPSRSRSASPQSGSGQKRKRRDCSHSPEGGERQEKKRSQSPQLKSDLTKSASLEGEMEGSKNNEGRRSRSNSPNGRNVSPDRKSQKSHDDEGKQVDPADNALTKDQRTVFVSQLVMRADERDIRRYFKRKVGSKVRDVILLRDKRTGRHKGCAYVELGNLQDVERALDASGKNPDFQRFPILIKRTEAEKNYSDTIALAEQGISAHAIAAAFGGSPDASASFVQLTPDGKRVEAQKVYVGSIDRCVTQAQIYALFSQFGPVDKVLLQMEPTTGISRGFAFLSFRDPKDANLAIQTMSGQLLAGRPLKTGWANQQSSAAGVEEIRSDQFPDDANEKIQKANVALMQLTGSGLVTMLPQVDPAQQQALGSTAPLGILPSAQVASFAEAALDMALGEVPAGFPAKEAPASAVEDAKVVGRSDYPTKHILVRNMFDKDEETEEGWECDIKLDFEDECAQFGKITDVMVMSKEPGGKIYASFHSVDDAMKCATALAGRWFDKRQLRVEFVDSIPH